MRGHLSDVMVHSITVNISLIPSTVLLSYLGSLSDSTLAKAFRLSEFFCISVLYCCCKHHKIHSSPYLLENCSFYSCCHSHCCYCCMLCCHYKWAAREPVRRVAYCIGSFLFCVVVVQKSSSSNLSKKNIILSDGLERDAYNIDNEYHPSINPHLPSSKHLHV